jgi:hypothetical protein
MSAARKLREGSLVEGATVADLLIEQPTKISNWLSTVRTAQAIGLTIPQSILIAPRIRLRPAMLCYRANGKNPLD